MRVLIVDDEQGARAKVKRFLAAHADCELVGEAENGYAAVKLIAQLQPDLVFLDINMPECDGFDALAMLPTEQRPHVIFATAYDDRAVQAFEVQALDYLLKPFDRQRFDAALERTRKHVSGQGMTSDVFAQLRSLLPGRAYPQQLLVQDGGSMLVVQLESVDFVESAANYVVLHVGKKQHIMRTTLSKLEAQLNPKLFCRVHRQYIVRLGAIREVVPWAKGDMQVVLTSDTQVKLSRRFKEQFLAAFG